MSSRDQEQDQDTETETEPETARPQETARVPPAGDKGDSEPGAGQAGPVAECVARLVAQAPPLTGRQREILTLLLRRASHRDQRSSGALARRGMRCRVRQAAAR
jgi:hypothetical protein